MLEELQAAFGDLHLVAQAADEPVVRVRSAVLAEVVAFLKSRGFAILIDLSAVDRLHREPRFDVVYVLYHLEHRRWLRLLVPVGGEEPEVPSIAHLFASANWAERECYDMFGIRFCGHPDLKRILMPDDWQGHPLRKDYPLTGSGPLPPLVRE